VIERARAAGKAIRVAPDAIKAITTSDYPTPAKRPANSRLDTSLLRETFGLHLPDWKIGVDHILDQIL
jgi:dTDP-4-dehydrorhamnose reductase